MKKKKFVKNNFKMQQNMFETGKQKLFQDKDEFESYNIMSMILVEIGFNVENISSNLARAYSGSFTGYNNSMHMLKVLFKKTSAYWNFTEREYIIIDLKLKTAKLYQKLNRYSEGADFLSDVFRQILIILKRENAIFPRKKKSYTFKDFLQNEIG